MIINLGAGWHYTPSHGGVELTAPDGRTAYFQPGDDAAEFYRLLDSIDDDDGHAALLLAFDDYLHPS